MDRRLLCLGCLNKVSGKDLLFLLVRMHARTHTHTRVWNLKTKDINTATDVSGKYMAKFEFRYINMIPDGLVMEVTGYEARFPARAGIYLFDTTLFRTALRPTQLPVQ